MTTTTTTATTKTTTTTTTTTTMNLPSKINDADDRGPDIVEEDPDSVDGDVPTCRKSLVRIQTQVNDQKS